MAEQGDSRRGMPVPFLVLAWLCSTAAFNLDVDRPSVFTGPDQSYFGFSVDFFQPRGNARSDVLIGAPRANTTGSVLERGAVYSCPWGSGTTCQQVEFDSTDNRRGPNGQQMEFKSKQWFGASVRSDGEHILACAPLYQWSTYGFSEREPVGTCFLKKGGTVVEYSPCRSRASTPENQGFCQAGFSADFVKNKRVVVGGPGSFYWQGQLISDDVVEVLNRYNSDFTNPYVGTRSTKPASAQYDDSYLGYSVTVGDFNTDGEDDYITGVPRGDKALGYVNIFNGLNMASMVNLTGSQMAAYFGHSVAATDVNNDGMMDVLVGAPLFMDRGSDGKLREVGQVSVYLGRGGFSFHPPHTLVGSVRYARYGSAIAALGDMDLDGFNDVAVSAPYGGLQQQGLVYIHNGRAGGLDPIPSQVLQGRWASNYMPASFGYSMSGKTDIDQNGYPDLLVGVFGADKAVLYRARPVISVNTTLEITPQILNPDDKSCSLPETSTNVTCFKVMYCLKARGMGAPSALNFRVDLVLDRLKHKGATKRVLFLQSRTSQYSKNMTVNNGKHPACEEQYVYLRDDSEFRDKITPIAVFMEYSLDYQQAADSSGLLPILDITSPSNVTKQVHILLDCGDDNICKPDLKLAVKSNQEQIYMGGDNDVTLEVSAENQGEGAYEAELHVYLPPQADFTGVGRSQALSRLFCSPKKENQTKMVVCDLGNPMKGGTKLTAELQFSFRQLSEQGTSVKFDMQIVSSNQFESSSEVVSSIIKLAVFAEVYIRRISAPDQVLLPIANWKPKEPPVIGDDIGPKILHVYELHNEGPSAFSKAVLDVDWPQSFSNGSLLYIMSYETDGAINCTTDTLINPFNLSNPVVPEKNVSQGDRGNEGRNRNRIHKRDIQQRDTQEDTRILDCSTVSCLKLRCQVGRLERRQSAILSIYSHLAVSTFLKAEHQNGSYIIRSSASFNVIEMPYKNPPAELPGNSTTISVSVLWMTEGTQAVPGWVVALAVLAGLLLLALLIFIMYKLGFFKRVRPPQEDCTEKEQLQPEENGNTDA